MNKVVLALAVLTVVALIGFFVLKKPGTQSPPSQTAPQSQNQTTDQTAPGYSAKLLAGKTSPFLEFNKADYEKAMKEGKIIFLNFYANWCPICRAESPVINDGFNGLKTDKIVGFRVNFNDSETDDDEKNLAKEFNVPYQHTKIFLKNGQEISRSGNQWQKADFDEAFAKALQ